MRALLGVAAAFALAACSKSSDKPRPDLGKMTPTEACRVISKRAFECKDTIVGVISAEMAKQGAPNDVIAKMSTEMSTPMPCDHVNADDLDPMISCYDDDCGKLATCFAAIAADAMRPMGHEDHGPLAPAAGSAAASQAPAPAPASGSN